MASMDGANCSELNFSNETCFKLSRNEFTSLFWTEVGISILAAPVCLFAILMIVFSKAYKRFAHRLSLYLIINALAKSISTILQCIPTKYHCGYVVVTNEQLCEAAGFLAQYTLWMLLLFMSWIALYLFVLGVFNHKYSSRNCEIGLVIVCLVVPLLFSIVPFIDFQNGTMYGLVWSWCWIKLTDNNCNKYKEGVIEQFVLSYGPLLIVLTLNFLAILVVIVVLYRGTRKRSGTLQNQYKEAMKEVIPLLLYPVVYNILVSVALINTFYALANKTTFPLWQTQAIIYPVLPLVIPLVFILHPHTLKDLKKTAKKWHPQSLRSRTHFVVSREDVGDTSVEALILDQYPRQLTCAYDSFLDHNQSY